MSQFSVFTLSGLYAYIDPASGSILLQVIIAGTLGAFGFFFRPMWRFFQMLRGKKAESAPETTEPGETAAHHDTADQSDPSNLSD